MPEDADPKLAPCAHDINGTHDFKITVMNNMLHGVMWCAKCGLQCKPVFFTIPRKP